ncbi:succinylglutamate desuccinylase/aspartoacylase family protein [Zavarzinia sp. CC-PAN008]|uniref:succinylglutamate desuccinylase/aspartoacylase family protein n=1 Tax=Zavarzinia sp. CC-PAN008 TaxID=3243332 RepID=UPI003F743197
MTRRTSTLPLAATSPGTARHLVVHSYGADGTGPKVYLQAAMHADELPGVLVLHHLLRRLDALPPEAILGRIVIVPFANPIGLGQAVHGGQMGRYDLDSRTNFNRHFPFTIDAVAQRVGPQLTDDGAANVALIRAAVRAALAELKPAHEAAVLRHALVTLACDADICLDLHCDLEALLHLFCDPGVWPALEDLARTIGAEAVYLDEASPEHPFDETIGCLFIALAKRFPDRPIPFACQSATIEYRGQADIADPVAQADADALLRFLMRRGVIAGDPGALPPLLAQATPLSGMDRLIVPAPGVLVWHRRPGDSITEGDVVAEVVDPASADPAHARTPIHARTSGRMIARAVSRLARPGHTGGAIAGATPLGPSPIPPMHD